MKQKLASLLSQRKAKREAVGKLAARVCSAAFTAEDDPEKIRKLAVTTAFDAALLSAAVSKANGETTVSIPFPTDGEPTVCSLLTARAVRDELIKAAKAFDDIAALPKVKIVTGGSAYDDAGNRVRTPDAKLNIAIDLANAREVASDFARRARLIDEVIQATNWTTEVEI